MGSARESRPSTDLQYNAPRPSVHTRRGVECYSTDQGTAPHHEYEKEMPRCHRGPRRFYPLLVYECVQKMKG